jgi:hypothetical protein
MNHQSRSRLEWYHASGQAQKANPAHPAIRPAAALGRIQNMIL